MESEDSNLLFSVILVLILVAISYFIGTMLSHKFFFYRRDRFVVLWYTFVVLARLTLDLPFVVMACFGPLDKSQSRLSSLAIPAKEYGRADARWMRGDTSIVALEMGTVVIEVVLGFLVVQGILYGSVYRHFAQTCVSFFQVCRVWLIFGPQILSGFADIEFSNPVHVALFIVMYNLIWFFAPALILYETYLDASTGVMKYVTPYRTKSVRSTKRSFSTLRNRSSWFWHS